ncbi:serine hydrolase domain-containing protein [Roseivirga sp. BDSF3-8]|uniref:serine hydrolase domain-containing protein n=1 Tax=Roseivirga sp. BDSF3-8 TaxID=3241598 RepID=UPI003531EB1E
MKGRTLLLGAGVVVACLTACDTDQAPSDTPLRDSQQQVIREEVPALLDSLVPALQAAHNVPAVGIAVVREGKVVHATTYGSHQDGRQAPPNTLFNVASITKPVTTITTLRLVQSGEWSLDEPLHSWWVDEDVEADPRHRAISTRHSLTHTTGFKNWRRMEPEGQLTIHSEPGSRYQYSGEGMEYLRKALEARFGKDLNMLADSLVFTPLDMKDATLAWLPDEDTARFAWWYDSNGQAYDVSYATPEVSAADDLIVSAGDLAHFAIGAMKPDFIGDSLYAEMITPQVAIHDNASMGLGWQLVQDLPGGHYSLSHEGGDKGVATIMVMLPQANSAVIVLTNGDNGSIICNEVVKQVIPFGEEIIRKLSWGGEIPEVVTVPDTLLDRYAGAYRTNQQTDLNFTKTARGLKIKGQGVPTIEIYPSAENRFFPADYELFFVFEATDSGMTFKLLNQGNAILEGTKKRK